MYYYYMYYYYYVLLSTITVLLPANIFIVLIFILRSVYNAHRICFFANFQQV